MSYSVINKFATFNRNNIYLTRVHVENKRKSNLVLLVSNDNILLQSNACDTWNYSAKYVKFKYAKNQCSVYKK